MITQINTVLEPVPSRQKPVTFSDDADTFFGKLPAWSNEANTLASEVNSVIGEVTAQANIAKAQVSLATEQASAAVSAQTVAAMGANDASASASNASNDRDYVAQQSAFIAGIYSLVGVGVDSDGQLIADINTASNVLDMALNSNGELVVTYL